MECCYIFRTIHHWHFCIFDFCEHWFALRRSAATRSAFHIVFGNLPHLSRATIGHFYWPAQGTRPALTTGCFAYLAHLTLLSLSHPLSYSLTLCPRIVIVSLLLSAWPFSWWCPCSSALYASYWGLHWSLPSLCHTSYFAWSVVGLSVCQSVCPPLGLCCDRVPSEGCSKILHELCPEMAFVKRWYTQRTNNEIVVWKINSVVQYWFIRSNKEQ